MPPQAADRITIAIATSPFIALAVVDSSQSLSDPYWLHPFANRTLGSPVQSIARTWAPLRRPVTARKKSSDEHRSVSVKPSSLDGPAPASFPGFSPLDMSSNRSVRVQSASAARCCNDVP